MSTTIATRIARPRMRSNVKALTPWSVKPSRRMPSTQAPMKAPSTVPLPPASSVPPITAEGERVQAPAGAHEQHLERQREADRPQDPGVGPAAEDAGERLAARRVD